MAAFRGGLAPFPDAVESLPGERHFFVVFTGGKRVLDGNAGAVSPTSSKAALLLLLLLLLLMTSFLALAAGDTESGDGGKFPGCKVDEERE